MQKPVIAPAWHGYLTIELTNHGLDALSLQMAMPIGQIVFHRLEKATEQPYGQQIPEPAIRAAIILTSRVEHVVLRIVSERAHAEEPGAVGIRREPAAATLRR